MKKFLSWLNKHFEEAILVLGVIVMILLIFLQVVMRFVFNSSLPWSEEAARYLFIWQVWLAVPFAVVKGRHIRLEILPDMVGPRGKLVLDLIFFVVSAIFFAYLGWSSISVVEGIEKMNQLTPVMQIPKWLCYLSVPVGCFLAVVRFIQYGILRLLRFRKDPTDTRTFALESET